MDPAIVMAIMSALSGVLGQMNGEKGKGSSTYNKGQLGTLDDAVNSIKGMSGNQDITQNPQYQQGQDWLSSLFNDQDFFNNFEAPLQRQFQEQTVPDLANRFASMGSGGSTGSTAFRNQLGREGSNLSTNIAALRGGMQQQGVNQGLQYAQQPFQNYMQMLQGILSPQPNNVYQPPSAGGFGSFAAPLAQGAITSYANRPFPGQSPSTAAPTP